MGLKEVKYVQIDDEKGILYSAGRQSLLIPATVVNAVESIFEHLAGREGADILTYKLGEALGRGYAKSLKAIIDQENINISLGSKIKMSCNAIFMEAGWGSIKIHRLDIETLTLEIEIFHSPSSEFLESENFNLEKGVLTGVFYEFTEEHVYCELISFDKKTSKVILKTSKEVTEEWKEKEKIVLISRKELEEKNKTLTEAYEQLKSAQKQLIQSEKMATIGVLAGGVAHEINTPLGTILVSAQMLKDEIASPDSQSFLGSIERSAKKCQSIIEQLLKYSRVSKDDFELVDISEIIKEISIILQHDLRKMGVVFETSLGEINKIFGNKNELEQVFMNLFVNSIDSIKEKFSAGADASNGKIVVRCYQQEDKLKVDFEDNGMGIKEEHLLKIFDPFFTTKDVGKGTGLGLSVIHGIIKKHNAQIAVSSAYGEGTKFTIIFPS